MTKLNFEGDYGYVALEGHKLPNEQKTVTRLVKVVTTENRLNKAAAASRRMIEALEREVIRMSGGFLD